MGRDFPPVQTGPEAHPASCTMGTGSFPGVKYGRGVLLTTHHLLVPWSRKSRAIPLPTLWATTGPVTGTLYLYLIMKLLRHQATFFPYITVNYTHVDNLANIGGGQQDELREPQFKRNLKQGPCINKKRYF